VRSRARARARRRRSRQLASHRAEPPLTDFPPPPPSLYPPYAASPYASYPGYYPPPPPPAKAEGLPPWLWVAVGVALAGLGGKLLEGAKSKQADVQAAMMQQMMKSMMGGAGAPPGFPPGFTPPRPPPPPPPAAARGATVDTTATAVPPKPAQPPPPPPAAAAAAPAAAAAAEAAKPPPSASYFRDADEVVPPATPGGAGAQAPPPPMPGGAPPGMTVDVLEGMMRDPNMQKLIYPYLPEGMRNPSTFEWMLKNPATRQQLETMLANSGGSFPGMPGSGAFPNLDMNSPEMKQQFDAMGMKPEDVISKIMSEPDMAAAMTNPRVQAAIMEYAPRARARARARTRCVEWR